MKGDFRAAERETIHLAYTLFCMLKLWQLEIAPEHTVDLGGVLGLAFSLDYAAHLGGGEYTFVASVVTELFKRVKTDRTSLRAEQ